VDLELKGKRALVTGSSKGIGAVIATTLAREGASVVVHGRNEESARNVVAEIERAGGRAGLVLGDLSEGTQAERIADEALAIFGGVDILINNAGVSIPGGWDDTDPQLWISLYNTNVIPAVRLCKKLAPLMQEAEWGRLIHIGSSSAAIGLPRAAEYAASKAALAAVSSSLAKHFGRFGVTSNILGVGTISNLGQRSEKALSTESNDPVYGMVTQGTWGHYNRNPLGRTGRAEEVAFVVAMLASPRSAFVNGALIRVDGGKVPNLGL
jgi:NAD(P)-dependent dehydrogenase (short-subunit alcohol dehydrogenase family)